MKAVVISYSLTGNCSYVSGIISEETGCAVVSLDTVTPYPVKGLIKFFQGGKAALQRQMPELKPYALPEDADIVIAAFGIAARVSRNAVNEARKKGIKAGMIRPITLWPFPKAPFKKAAEHAKAFISVELSMGQMIEDVKLAMDCKVPVTLCNRAGGMIPSPEQVLSAIEKANGGEN